MADGRCWRSSPSPGSNEIVLGPLHLRAYGLMIALGVFAAIEISRRRWAARGGDPDDISAIALWAVPAGLIGARIYHVITDNELYRGHWFDNPFAAGAQSPLMIWNGGLGIPGGIALGVGGRRVGRPPAGHAAVGRHRRRGAGHGRGPGHRPARQLLQPGAVRPSDHAAVGPADRRRPTGPPATRSSPPSSRRSSTRRSGTWPWPALLVALDRRRVLRPGRIFALYIGGYALGRLLVESLRSDPANKILGLRVNTWTSMRHVRRRSPSSSLWKGLRRRRGRHVRALRRRPPLRRRRPGRARGPSRRDEPPDEPTDDVDDRDEHDDEPTTSRRRRRPRTNQWVSRGADGTGVSKPAMHAGRIEREGVGVHVAGQPVEVAQAVHRALEATQRVVRRQLADRPGRREGEQVAGVVGDASTAAGARTAAGSRTAPGSPRRSRTAPRRSRSARVSAS